MPTNTAPAELYDAQINARESDEEPLYETPEGRMARAMKMALAFQAKRTYEPAEWALAVQPKNPPTDGTNGMHRIVGILQTPETDEELTALLQELS